MERLAQFLTYRNNILRKLGITGLKKAHLEANPEHHKKILYQVTRRVFKDQLPSQAISPSAAAKRTLAQFLCQEELFDSRAARLRSFIFFAATTPLLIIWIVMSSFVRRPPHTPCRVFAFELGDLNYVREDYNQESFASSAPKDFYLGLNELSFLAKTIFYEPRIALQPRLIANLFRWFSYYGWVLRAYNPRVIATFFEGTAASSLLTAYLDSRNCRHENYAHGEHFRFDCYCAFSDFHKYTIWGRHFRQIQVEKNMRESIFVVRAPSHFHQLFYETRLSTVREPKSLVALIHSRISKGTKEYDHLLQLFRKLDSTWRVYLRPHPVDRDGWPQVMADFISDLSSNQSAPQLAEELPERLGMTNSLRRTANFVGTASAALLEAWVAGCRVIYVPGVVQNEDVFSRHSQSPHVFWLTEFTENMSNISILSSPIMSDDDETRRIKKLFEIA